MSANSKIEWTDNTFNPWIGCTKVAPGCLNCYAKADMDDRKHRAKWGPRGTRSKTSADYWRQPLKWNRQAAERGERTRVFCASLADVFEDWEWPIVDSNGRQLFHREHHAQPVYCRDDEGDPLTMSDLRRDLFALIDATPHLIWQLVTKRPENVRRMWVSRVETGDDLDEIDYRPNVHLLTSVSDQETADKAIPELLKCRDLVPVLGVSAEPLLAPVDLAHWRTWIAPPHQNRPPPLQSKNLSAKRRPSTSKASNGQPLGKKTRKSLGCPSPL